MVEEDPWAPTRWRFLAPGRGPEDWGKVLYEGSWGLEQAVRSLQIVTIWAAVLVMTPLLGFSIVDSIINESISSDRLFIGMVLLVMMAFMAVLAVFVTLRMLSRSEFRVYEAGPTMVTVPRSKGLFRREVLIPKARIRSVRLRMSSGKEKRPTTLIIEHLDGQGQEAAMTVETRKIDDLLRAFHALDTIAPSAVSDEIKELMNPGEVTVEFDKSVEIPQGRSSTMFGLMGLAILFTAAYPLGMVVPFLPRIVAHPQYYLDLLAIFIGMSVMFLHWTMSIFLQMYQRQWTWGHVTEVPGGFSVPLPWPASMVLKAKTMVPYTDIRRARVRWGGKWGQEAFEVITSDGHRFDVFGTIYGALKRRPEFVDRNRELVNTQPVPADNPPMVRIDRVKVIVLMVAIAFAVAMSMETVLEMGFDDSSDPPPELDEPVAFEDMLMFYVMVTMLVIVSFQMMMVLRYNAVRRMAIDFSVDRSSMRIPRAKEPFRTVARAEVEQIEVTPFSRILKRPVLDVETTKGSFRLPVELVSEIREHGYVVEDPQGLLADLGDDAQESGPMS